MPILVGIVSRNRAAILPKALESALSQSAGGIRVAVIDDASTDDTRSLEARYPQVEWTFRAAPDGYMSARNAFMAREEFDYFVSLDDDSWFVKGDEIELAMKLFAADPQLAAVAFDIQAPDQPETRSRTAPRGAGTFIGCGHMLRLSAVRKVGSYVKVPGGYGGEEMDLCLRLLDAGYKVVELPGVHVWHDKTPVARDRAYQHRSLVCNDLAMAVMRAPAHLLPAMVPWKMCRQFYLSWRDGMVAPYLSGLTMFLRSLPSIWHWRRPVRVETLRTYWQLMRS